MKSTSLAKEINDNLILYENKLPNTISDLKDFITVGREKLKAYKTKFHVNDKLGVAKEVRDKTLSDAQGMAGALLYAEAKMGDLLRQTVRPGKPKKRIVTAVGQLPEGISRNTSHYTQKLSQYYELIEEVILEAKKYDEVPTRQSVLQKIKEKEKQEKKEELKRLGLDFQNNESVKVIHGDFREVCEEIPEGSIDHIITDPPYAEQYLPLWEDLSKTASRILKPGGFCVTYTGQLFLPEVISGLSEYLLYYWQLVLLHTGPTCFVHPRRINTFYKPILVYYKPPLNEKLGCILDVIKGSAGKRVYMTGNRQK